jgi:protein-L-isoaspartate O-methyltransferase
LLLKKSLHSRPDRESGERKDSDFLTLFFAPCYSAHSMSLTEDLNRYYNERSSVYDVTAGYTDPESEKLREPTKQRFQQIFRGRNVLEIACGTGYWTAIIAQAAESVLAIDNNRSLLEQAQKRCRQQANVRFQMADAFTLKGVSGSFNAAFGHWWWSHIPKKNIKAFLTALHIKLIPGAIVLFNDQLPYDGFFSEQDNEGNTIEKRVLPNGRSFMIVKNFPTEREIEDALSDFADDVRYTRYPEESSWEVVYRTKQQHG